MSNHERYRGVRTLCVTAQCGGKLASWSVSDVKGGDVENEVDSRDRT